MEIWSKQEKYLKPTKNNSWEKKRCLSMDWVWEPLVYWSLLTYLCFSVWARWQLDKQSTITTGSTLKTSSDCLRLSRWLWLALEAASKFSRLKKSTIFTFLESTPLIKSLTTSSTHLQSTCLLLSTCAFFGKFCTSNYSWQHQIKP